MLVSVDTMRVDTLHAFDPAAAPLPRLDAFAAGSVRFTHAISTAPWTLPSHASMLTGLYPHHHGATDRRVKVDAHATTLAELLHEQGYETVAVTGGGYVRPEFGLDRGFDRYESWSPADGTIEAEEASVFGRAIAFVDQRDESDRPLFLFVHTFALHDYFDLHPWAAERLATPPARDPVRYRRCLQGLAACDAADWKTLRGLYRAELPHIDQAFGRLLDALAARGLLERAVVVFTSDHGEGFDPEHGRIHHGGRVDEDVLRVPLLVRAPGVTPRDVDAPVSLVDLLPSLVELAGGQPPPGLDGRSLVPALYGNAAPADRALLSEGYDSAWWQGTRVRSETIQPMPLTLAVLRGTRWYLRMGGHEELFDIATDPRERRDLAPTAPDLPELRQIADQRITRRPDTDPIAESDLLRDQLRALGYSQ